MNAKEDIQQAAAAASEARKLIATAVHGQDEAVTALLVALASDGHVLLEGIPGVGKTTLAKTFAAVTGLSFSRIQLTPDLMPTDITGHSFYNQKTGDFELRKGAVFTNVLLADELNRTPPRTQAALLEVMQERQATIDGTTYPLPQPFIVVATKNPIEVEGVFRLPEAELDRFMVHVKMGYPDRDIEDGLLAGPRDAPSVGAMKGLVKSLRDGIARVFVHADLRRYLLDIVRATRGHDLLDLGASPRAAKQFMIASRAAAMLAGRHYVVPDDIKGMAYPVMGHRLLRSAEAEVQEVEVQEILDGILDQIEVPLR